MAKSGKNHININLGSHGQKTMGTVFYQWAITAGRIIIILVELIALGTLGYRFIVDREIVDQHDEIAKQEILIRAQVDNEKEYRAIQEKLNHIKTIEEDTTKKFTVMNEIIKNVRSGIFFSTNLNINEESATFEGSTFSILTLTNFINELKKIPIISAISINKVYTSDEGVQFQITINMKTSQNAL